MRSKIVITGMGIVSPLGCGVDKVWERLINGESGIAAINRFNVDDFPIRIAGLVPDHVEDGEAGLNHEAVVSFILVQRDPQSDER